VAQGERNKLISTAPPRSARTLAASDPSAPEAANGADLTATATVPEQPRRPVPKLALALGGAGLVGVGGFALMTYWGRKDDSMLGKCSGTCSQGDVNHIHNMYLAADISLGVGVAALAGAYWAWVRTRGESATEADTSTKQAFLFGAAPTSSGGVATVSGKF
jgi:hypothetical protein